MSRAVSGWVVAVVVGIAIAACSKPPRVYKSNFTAVTLGGGAVTAADGKPYTGTLIAVDSEIPVVATSVLAPALVDRMAGVDTTGLVLLMPMSEGKPNG